MKIKLVNKKSLTSDIKQFDFDIKGKNLKYKSGQFASINLINGLENEFGHKRFFSFVSSPNNHEILSVSTIISSSPYKQKLDQLALGTEVELGPISGHFTLPANITMPLIFIAGGIGITPFISMLRFIREEKIKTPILLLYSVKSITEAVYLDELKKCEKSSTNFQLILTVTQDPAWTGEKRRIEAEFLKEHVKNLQKSLFYIVGPVGLVQSIKMILVDLGVPEAHLKTDHFSGY